MILIIAKWLLVYVLEHKHNFHVEHFLTLTCSVAYHPQEISSFSFNPALFFWLHLRWRVLILPEHVAPQVLNQWISRKEQRGPFSQNYHRSISVTSALSLSMESKLKKIDRICTRFKIT